MGLRQTSRAEARPTLEDEYMAEDKTRFQSIYGDDEDEFEIEDISDETLTIPTDAVRAAREEELASEVDDDEELVDADVPGEAEEHSAQDEADKAEIPAQRSETRGADIEESLPEEPLADDSARYDDEEFDDISYEDAQEERLERSHRASAYAPSDRYEERDEYDMERDDAGGPDADKVSILSYIGHAILFTIPVIGTILMLVYIISDSKNPHLRHLAQIWLVTLVLVCIGLVVAAYMFGLA